MCWHSAQQTLSIKRVSVLGSVGPWSMAITPLCCCSTKVAAESVSKFVWLCFSKTLFTGTEIWIVFMCHEILKTFFFLAQSVKTILDSKAIGQRVEALDLQTPHSARGPRVLNHIGVLKGVWRLTKDYFASDSTDSCLIWKLWLECVKADYFL